MRRGAVSSYFQASSSPLPLRLQCNLGGGLTSLDAAESGDVEMTMEAQEHFILVVSLNIFRGKGNSVMERVCLDMSCFVIWLLLLKNFLGEGKGTL